jgi:hypothetical protein
MMVVNAIWNILSNEQERDDKGSFADHCRIVVAVPWDVSSTRKDDADY